MIPEPDRPIARAAIVREWSTFEDWLEPRLAAETNLSAGERALVLGRLRATLTDDALAFPTPTGTAEERLQATVAAKDRALVTLALALVSRELRIVELERALQAPGGGR